MQVLVISTPSASKRGDRAALEVQHPRLLLEPMRSREIGAARIGDGRNAHAPLVGRQLRHAFEPFDAGSAQRLGVGHDVGLRHRHEVAGAQILPDLDLMLDRPLRGRAEFAGAQCLFLVRSFIQLAALMFSSFASLWYLAKSSRTRRANASALPPTGSWADCRKLLRIAGSASALFISG